jgi:Protein of unknown function (DUF3298)
MSSSTRSPGAPCNRRAARILGCALLTGLAANGCSSNAASPTSVFAVGSAPAPTSTTPELTTSVPVTLTSSTSSTTTLPATSSPADTVLVVERKTEKADSQATRSGYSLEYPVITDGPKGTDTINDFVKNTVTKQLDDWNALVVTDQPATQNLPDGANYSFDLSTTRIESPTADLVVWVFGGDRFTGGAHPLGFSSSYVFSALTGEVLALTDLLTKDALAVIADEALRQLTQYMTENGSTADALDATGYAPTVENYRTFWPTADGLHIDFQPYQVGAYAIGSPSITVPWDSLVEFIPATSPLKALADAN